MAVNLRFEASTTTSPDCGPFLTATSNGHRGHGVSSSSMDRSSGFRDSHEGRSYGSAPACDPVPLSQLLSLEKLPLEDRCGRQPELKRATNAAMGSITEDTVQAKSVDSLSPEELKRMKNSVSEIGGKARERSKHFSEAIAKLDKFRSPLKKRSRPDSGASPCDRPLQLKAPPVPDAGKNKGLGPNKRLRTSIDGGRPNNATTKKTADRESPRSLPSPSEDKVRAPGEAWDKAKLKGRRSAIKSDSALPAIGNGVLEQEREHKWSAQHRLSQETRPRPSETHGLRSGPVHGVTSMHKGEASVQMNGSARGLLKRDVDPAAGSDRYVGTDKERIPKNGLNPPLQDDPNMLTMSPIVTKGKAARGPRSSSVATTNPSHLGRAASFTDRDKPIGAPKIQQTPGQSTRKRPAPSRSSSPVAQWVGQRPQKMARVARRVNIPPGGAVPLTDGLNSTADVLPERDPAAVAMRSTSGASGVSRRISAHSPTQGKPRSERSERSALVSESEESEEVGDSKLKGKKQGDWEPRTLPNPKAGMVLPPKGSHPVYREREEVGDGVRRHVRSGRNFSMPKPVPTVSEKSDLCTTTAKQLRSARTDKAERLGRTPTKKATADRKSLTRIRRPGSITADAGSVLLSPADSDDDHEELANAVRAAVEASAAKCSNDFWKELEPYFAFITADDLSYLRQLADSKLNDSSTPSTECISNANLENEISPDRLDVRTGGRMGGSGGWFDKIYPLSQRLLAALINEGEEEDAKYSEHDPLRDVYSSATSNFSDKYADGFQRSSDGGLYSNGHGHHPSVPCYDEASEPDDILADKLTPDNNHFLTGTTPEAFAASRPGPMWDEYSFDDRILLELQSIGLAVEPVPDLSQREEDELCLEICKLQEELKSQASVNRERIEMLERAISSRRGSEARERERLALSKLVESAYTKRKGYRGSTGSAGSKAAGTKGARAAALAFSKRTLARVRQFESGHSCIVDSALRDVLLCKQQFTPAVDGGDVSVPQVASESIPLPRPGGKLVVRRSDGNRAGQAEMPFPDPPRHSSRDRDISPENGPVALRNGGFGGAKGKRSERERDGKGQGKESHRKNDNDRVPRQGLASVKGERKTKTKPRQKAVFKDVNGLLGKPEAEAPKQAAPVGQPLIQPLLGGPDDLPEVLGDNEIGDWLSLDTSLQGQDHEDFLGGVGLDVPMDDLAELGMMM